MGILSKLTSTASSSLTIGAVLAKTASLAAFSALDTSLQTSKMATDLAFGCVEDIVKLAEEVLESSGIVGDRVTNIAFVTAIMMAKMMPGQIGNMVRMLKIVDDEVIEQIEDLCDNIITIIETGDLQGIEAGVWNVLEAGLFGVTALQPNILLALFMVMQVLVTASNTLVSREMMTEEEAEMLTRNICARIWRTYGEVYHGQEWIGLDNIPEDGALIVYYHGPVPVDYFGLVAEMWLRRNKTVHSVVDRSLMQIPYMENLRKQFNLFPGTVDSCADILKSGEYLGIAPGGAFESLFGDSNYPVLWGQRAGFARVAIKANKPIIPVFTENIRENTLTLAGRMSVGRSMWESLYKSTKMPVVPMYGLFPVKLKTHIGAPIYPSPGVSPEELSKQVVSAVEELIAQHQQLPGTLTQALAARMEDPGLSRSSSSSSRLNLFSEAEERLPTSSSDSSLLGVYTVNLGPGPQQAEPETEDREDTQGGTEAVVGKEGEKIERKVPKITFTVGREE